MTRAASQATTLLTASNGKLRARSDDGTTAFSWWHEGYPSATYRVALAIYAYHIDSDWYVPSPADSTQLVFYDFPSDTATWRPVQSKVKGMIEMMAAKYGPYPYLREKYGHAQFTFGGGEENQTISSMGSSTEMVVARVPEDVRFAPVAGVAETSLSNRRWGRKRGY